MNILAFMMPGPTELIIIGVIAVLLFGSRLPKVARSVGSSFVEFKRGLAGVEEDIKTPFEEVRNTVRDTNNDINKEMRNAGRDKDKESSIE